MKKKGECPGEHTRRLIRRGLRGCTLHDQIRFLPQLLMFNYKSCLYHYWNKTGSNIKFLNLFSVALVIFRIGHLSSSESSINITVAACDVC